MIIVRLAGGLGNQIFQLGAALLMANVTKIKKIKIDDRALGSYEAKHKNELFDFFDLNKIDLSFDVGSSLLTKIRIAKVFPFKVYKYPFVSDSNFSLALKRPNKSFILLDGYFQKSLKQEDFNREVSLLKKIIIPNNMKQKDECVVHIRGGDFVKLGWNSVTPIGYYIEAIKKMINDYGINKFNIVTDDRDYANSILNELNDLNFSYSYIGGSLKEDFNLIGSFNYRILSSSTFALWASAFGANDESTVIAPEYWLPNKKREIYLPNEIRVSYK
ncbi:alpha-1,2-fucosyltransferase [Sulfurimonas aquatica]|uniref:Alpha-1,2-fucosyltransferase n=1 Tax=Sulfurimonas aquatica TaxID=2672570 RepID=A0A975B1E8_9BACT|nr:alpha-1,2-fucosyltransferase [Sulfurimonas aquatica]QSZ42370.1 alpha-1,2-fucosyltransferase [Sulfurimonas aquatica]